MNLAQRVEKVELFPEVDVVIVRATNKDRLYRSRLYVLLNGDEQDQATQARLEEYCRAIAYTREIQSLIDLGYELPVPDATKEEIQANWEAWLNLDGAFTWEWLKAVDKLQASPLVFPPVSQKKE